MADLDTLIPQLSFGQADKETTVNELFDAASPAMLFGRNGITSTGLGFGLLGGRLNGVIFANVVIDLPDNATVYLSIDLATRVFSSESAGFKAGETPLYKLTTSGGLVTNYEDHRQMLGGGAAGPLVMADITDKQGRVLDDLIVIEDYFAEIDNLMTDHGYIVKADVGTNGLMSGATILVASEGGVISQTMLSPLTAKFGIRYYTGSWSDWKYGISTFDSSSWFSSTTAEAANAVVTDSPDQVFLRSVSSDEFKTGIEPMLDEYADAIVQGTQPIYYRSTCEADPDDWSYWGISAEQLATIDPRLVHWGHSTKEVAQPFGMPPKTVPDLDSPLKPVGVQYSRVVPALLNVVKRQGAAIAALEARLAILEGGGQ